jgi:hypothetical protein
LIAKTFEQHWRLARDELRLVGEQGFQAKNDPLSEHAPITDGTPVLRKKARNGVRRPKLAELGQDAQATLAVSC